MAAGHCHVGSSPSVVVEAVRSSPPVVVEVAASSPPVVVVLDKSIEWVSYLSSALLSFLVVEISHTVGSF